MKEMKTEFESFYAKLTSVKTIVLSAHVSPDGDAVGSVLGLYHMLKNMGKEVYIYSKDPYPYNFMFLEGADKASSDMSWKDPDMFILLDCGTVMRAGGDMFVRIEKSDAVKVLFDHHIHHSQIKNFDYLFIDEKASSTAALVYRFMETVGYEPDKNSAEAIYSGIMSDTGGLRYNSADNEAFATLGKLVHHITPWEIATKIWENIPYAQLQLLVEVLGDMKLLVDGKLSVIVVTLQQLKKYGLTPDNIDSFINYGRSIDTVEISARFREVKENEYKVSLRSKGAIDASKIAHEFGGGGHKNAASFFFRGSYQEGLKFIEEIALKVLS